MSPDISFFREAIHPFCVGILRPLICPLLRSWKNQLVTWTDKMRSFFRGTWLLSSRQKWNDAYRRGRWEGLKDPAEEPRLDAVAMMLRKHAPHARVLEIGCGEALLQRRLSATDYTRWAGIDLSDVAIARSQQYAGSGVTYESGDMLSYKTDEMFDAILFTESIYYVPQRDQLIQCYCAFLQPQGVFIVSVHDQACSFQVWSEVESVLDLIETVVTENERGQWTCKVLRPRSPVANGSTG